MARFSEEQKRIALLLIHGPKTAEELNGQLNIPFNKLTDELKAMIKLGVIEKQGFPTKYSLKKNIATEVQKRKKIAETDINKLRIRAFIEMQAIEEELLKKQLQKLEETMDKDKSFTLYNLDKAKVEKQGDFYSTYFEINFSVKDFASLIRFMFFYGPSSVEVVKPAKIEFSAQDLQDGLMETADMVQKYSNAIHKLLSREELEKFNAELYK
jgi:hypothetical protein